MKQILMILLLSTTVIFYYGCSEDDDPINPPATDTVAVNYNDLIISERTLPFDDALSAVDLFSGMIVKDSSRYKDANLIDSIALGDSVYYLRSGDLSDFPVSVPGYRTRFK
ncbi:MAG TPA: hypothetical protein PKE39_08970, partial [Ignavibacteria bacterium]|nr:hypothetical protein [Ignavibacteria bacterium]